MAIKFSKPGASAPLPVAPAAAPTDQTGTPGPERSPDPVTPASPAAPLQQAQSTALAAQSSPRQTTSLGFYTGAEEDTEFDPKDIKLPRLNLVQGMSGDELKAIAPEGQFVYKQALKLEQPFRAVVAGVRPKRYIEKTVYGSNQEPRYADSLQQVFQLGGTDNWRDSKENVQARVRSEKPWFMPMVTMLLLIERPEGAPEEYFPIEADGKLYAPALYTAKSTSFGSFFVPIQSEKATGLLRAGYNTRFIGITSRKEKAYVPVPKFLEATSEALRAAANQVVGA